MRIGRCQAGMWKAGSIPTLDRFAQRTFQRGARGHPVRRSQIPGCFMVQNGLSLRLAA
jgi:hypothetical protein